LLVPGILGMVFLRKNVIGRIVAFGFLATMVWAAETWWLSAMEPNTAAHLAVQQMGGGDSVASNVRVFDAGKDALHVIAGMAVLLAALGCFGGYLKPMLVKLQQRFLHATTLVVGLLALSLLTGCMKPYDRPEYVEIDTSETGFLIPLEGDGTQQARFQSEDYLKQRKVATKRVQVLHRWSQEGRMVGDGRWIPTVRLVKVNRSPVTREWSSGQSASGTAQSHAPAGNDRAIWIESADSVGFSMGFMCTAFIAEDDAAKFLYWYPSGSLAEVMDQEVRGRIQQVSAEVAAKYPLDALRSRKQEIADTVKKDVTNFFTTRGVTVTTVGMFGGMTYENPEIQRSIDQTFIAQQLKTVSLAKFEAQQKENERIELEANGLAERARREASGLADAKRTAAAAEAQAIREVSKALGEAQQNPLLYQFKALELEKARVEKWDGKYPVYFMGMGTSNPSLMLQVPAPGVAAAAH
ncbi:MAG: Band 7 protein, partial [Pedosphaera sp.]|nr:Band 7 protein [Pedosphaera sp.]